MSEAWCEHTDLPRSGCGHCRPAVPPEPLTVQAATVARFYGDCQGCGGSINEGDTIYLTDEHEAWICGGCVGL